MTDGGLRAPIAGRVTGDGSVADLGERVRRELADSGLVALDGAEPRFVLRLGPGGAPGGPGGAGSEAAGPRLGVWRFEAGEAGEGGLRPACRSAVAAGAHGLNVRLVAREVGADGRTVVVREGRLPVSPHSFAETERAVAVELARWPVYACRGLLGTGELEGPRTLGEGGGAAVEPGEAGSGDPGEAALGGALVRLRVAGRWLRRAARTLFRHDQWRIGVIDRPVADLLAEDAEPNIRWEEAPRRGAFRADPFGLRAGGETWVLYEEFDYERGRGRIAAERWEGGGDVAERCVAFEEDHHLSYPYLVQEDGEIYCVPEASESGRVALYRAVEFPAEWERVGVLLEDEAALDCTVFRHAGRWWLFAADDRTGPRHVLRAWYAGSLRGAWRAHAANPVKVDVDSARPAGTPFRHGGELYRPAQGGARRYGEALVLNRVDVLTPDRFAETVVRRIDPDPDGPCPHGVHTLSRLGPDRCLIDGNRATFSHHEFLRRFRDTVGL